MIVSDVKEIHHYHDPTTSQVHKAVYQWLSDHDFAAKATECVEKKVDETVTRYINNALGSERFNKLVIDTVIQTILYEKKFRAEPNMVKAGYTYANHVKELVEKELQRLVLAEYKVTIAPRISEGKPCQI